jgi:hypothetical protein
MELAGELVAGRFVAGVRSLQFASPAIAAELEEADAFAASPHLWHINCCDPASPAGLSLEEADERLQPRLPSTRLCFRGARLAAVSLRSGKELLVHDETLAGEEIAAFVKMPRLRAASPLPKIAVEKINGRDAARSPWAGALKEAGFIADRGKLFLW